MSTPLVVAHRGSSAEAPEHTLVAYKRAVAQGADALECDVRLTRDGVLVCVHDRRLERTSTGQGVLSTKQFADLVPLDFGSWMTGSDDDDDPDDVEERTFAEDADRRRVLTFERLLQLVLDQGSGIQLHVETKHPTRYGPRVERELVRLMERYGVTRPRRGKDPTVSVMSYSPIGLSRVAALAPQVPRVLLFDRVPRWLSEGHAPPFVNAVGLSVAALLDDPAYAAKVHRRGRGVFVFIVNEPEDVERVLDIGVDAVITDRPKRVRDAVRRRQDGAG